jgi:hypothetical protein
MVTGVLCDLCAPIHLNLSYGCFVSILLRNHRFLSKASNYKSDFDLANNYGILLSCNAGNICSCQQNKTLLTLYKSHENTEERFYNRIV